MLLYWQFNTEPKCGRRKQEQPRRCAPHIENLVTVPSQQSAQRSTSNTEAYRQSQHRTPHHNPRTQNFLGTTFHIQHRSIQTKVNTAPHTTTQELKTPSAQRSTSNTEAYRQKSTPYHTPQPKNSKPLRHNVPHPRPKHTDKSQHRITHHNPRTLKKKPEGCAEGPWLYGPFAVFPQLPKAKKPGTLPRK